MVGITVYCFTFALHFAYIIRFESGCGFEAVLEMRK